VRGVGIAAEGADEVRLRLDAVVREKCGGMSRAPVRWYEREPMLLHKGAVERLIAMARQADASLQEEFGLPLGLIVIDTFAACAGYSRSGDEYDNAVGQATMNALKAMAQAIGCFVLGEVSRPNSTRRVSREELLGDFDETAARDLFLTKGLDGKPHQLPTQLRFGRFADLPRLDGRNPTCARAGSRCPSGPAKHLSHRYQRVRGSSAATPPPRSSLRSVERETPRPDR
jgi:hypothetical protein